MPNPPANPLITDREHWKVIGRPDSVAFFQALPALLPDATHAWLFCPSMATDVQNSLAPYREESAYGHQGPEYFCLGVTTEVWALMAALADTHAEPELFDHLVIERHQDRILEWFDAFFDPLLVSISVPRPRLIRFAGALGLSFEHHAPAS